MSLAISASARGMAASSAASSNVRKTTKTYVYKTDSDGNVTSHTDVQVSGASSSESCKLWSYRRKIFALFYKNICSQLP